MLLWGYYKQGSCWIEINVNMCGTRKSKYSKLNSSVAILNATAVSCLTPNVTSWAIGDGTVFGTLFLAASSSGVAIGRQAYPFMFRRVPFIESIRPESGQSDGGTPVRVSARKGSGIWFNSSISCRFGATTVPAKFFSQTHIECVSPPLEKGGNAQVSLSVSDNNIDFSNEVPYHFIPRQGC